MLSAAAAKPLGVLMIVIKLWRILMARRGAVAARGSNLEGNRERNRRQCRHRKYLAAAARK